jgi:hypothetical protein
MTERRQGQSPLPPFFFAHLRPRADGSVTEQLHGKAPFPPFFFAHLRPRADGSMTERLPPPGPLTPLLRLAEGQPKKKILGGVAL